MLSLPLIPPPADPIRTHFRPRAESPPPANPSQPHHQQQHRQQQRRDEERKAHNARSPLALLAADEAAIVHRKTAIQNFGSYWIRPPGISKTLQAMNEEALEAAEQEEMMRQEQGLRDMQAQQQAEELREQAAQNAEQEEEEGGGERDLDEDIPDADAEGEGEDDVETSAVEAADVTFNEDSMVEGSRFVEEEGMDQEQYAVMEVAELTGAAQDEEDLGMDEERDLDDSVPEAGSYQHTDTELEDSTDESALDDSFAVQSARRSARHSGRLQQQVPLSGALHGGLQERIRAQTAAGEGLARSPGSLNLSSSLLETSFVGSSPVMQRASQQGGRGRGGRRRGRES